MKVYKLSIILLLISLFAIKIDAQNNPLNLRIVRGGQAEVYNKDLNLIGHVTPGSEVKINGIPVHVYKTGSFGTKFTLTPGENLIYITAVKGGNQLTESTLAHSVIYSLTPPEREIPERPEPLDTCFNVITLENAYLNSSSGTDRLGGAKINFLAENIPLKVVRVEDKLYKVQLSENRYAYIPVELTDSADITPGKCITSSWRVSNEGTVDRLHISLNRRLPYTLKEERFPNRLTIDIYGAMCNSNWITQYLDTKMIESVDIQQIDTDIIRVTVFGKKSHFWGYNIGYDNRGLYITFRHEPDLTLKGMTIGLDAGHGGSALGAVSPAGFNEKDLNLSMVYMLKEMLEKKGAKVVISRTGDYDMAMADRKKIFIDGNIDILLSVHCNAGGSPFTPMGTSTYYKHINNRDLAKSILESMLDLKIPNYGLIGNFNFSLNAPTEYQNVLVETLFMSSLPDEELISTEEFQREIMKKVVVGLEKYLKKCKEENKKYQ